MSTIRDPVVAGVSGGGGRIVTPISSDRGGGALNGLGVGCGRGPRHAGGGGGGPRRFNGRGRLLFRLLKSLSLPEEEPEGE
jgi:hypothetical protein